MRGLGGASISRHETARNSSLNSVIVPVNTHVLSVGPKAADNDTLFKQYSSIFLRYDQYSRRLSEVRWNRHDHISIRRWSSENSQHRSLEQLRIGKKMI